jgi:cytoskeletal protein CcmA (bactofilin family)
MADPTNTTVIGADTHIKGDMTFDSTARLLGTFEGKITSKGELQVANGATCRASVEASKVLVDGEVDGNLAARERVELTAKAKMKGDLVSARLVVAEGAAFTGHVTVGPDATKAFPSGGTAPSMTEAKPAGMATTAPANRPPEQPRR